MNGRTYYTCIAGALLSLGFIWYIDFESGYVRTWLQGLVLVGTFISSAVYWQTWNGRDETRVYLDVVMIDRQIDLWRGRLCAAQHHDDYQEELEAQLYIDAYQEIRVNHGLCKLEEV